MAIVSTVSLESNRQIKINFNGGDLSSDGGLLLVKEFAAKTGLSCLVKKLFHTNDTATMRHHTDADNLMQMVYQIIGAYFEDDCADELTDDPVMTAILEEGFNFHYQAHGYHPLLCYDGLTGDLLKAELRDGTQYCSKDADQFMVPLMQEYRKKSPSMPLYLRGDSGFASPDLYEACENNDCKYAIRLKQNSTLIKLAADADEALYRATRQNQVDYAVEYGEFMYQAQAGTWSVPRRVVFKIKKPKDQLTHLYTFAVPPKWSMPTGCRSAPLPITFSTGSGASRCRPVCADSALTPSA